MIKVYHRAEEKARTFFKKFRRITSKYYFPTPKGGKPIR